MTCCVCEQPIMTEQDYYEAGPGKWWHLRCNGPVLAGLSQIISDLQAENASLRAALTACSEQHGGNK